MRSLREGGAGDAADVLTRRLSEYSRRDITALQVPSVPSGPLVANFAALRAEIIVPYFAARRSEQTEAFDRRSPVAQVSIMRPILMRSDRRIVNHSGDQFHLLRGRPFT